MNSLQLNINDITLLDKHCNKKQAIEAVAKEMIKMGLVKDDYIQAMFDRDQQISTFLGNGIAIPHGTTEKRDSVLQTGLKVLFCRDGIKWDEENNIAYVIIGIAAKDNEHIDILRQLTRAVIADNTLARIQNATTKDELLVILKGE